MRCQKIHRGSKRPKLGSARHDRRRAGLNRPRFLAVGQRAPFRRRATLLIFRVPPAGHVKSPACQGMRSSVVRGCSSPSPRSGRLGGAPQAVDSFSSAPRPHRNSVSSGGGAGRRRWRSAKEACTTEGHSESKDRSVDYSSSAPVSLSPQAPLSVDCPLKGINLNDSPAAVGSGSDYISAHSLWDDLPRMAMKHCSSFGSFVRGCFRPASVSSIQGF